MQSPLWCLNPFICLLIMWIGSLSFKPLQRFCTACLVLLHVLPSCCYVSLFLRDQLPELKNGFLRLSSITTLICFFRHFSLWKAFSSVEYPYHLLWLLFKTESDSYVTLLNLTFQKPFMRTKHFSNSFIRFC